MTRLSIDELRALRAACAEFRAERSRGDSGWTYNKPAWRLWNNAEAILDELIERRERDPQFIVSHGEHNPVGFREELLDDPQSAARSE